MKRCHGVSEKGGHRQQSHLSTEMFSRIALAATFCVALTGATTDTSDLGVKFTVADLGSEPSIIPQGSYAIANKNLDGRDYNAFISTNWKGNLHLDTRIRVWDLVRKPGMRQDQVIFRSSWLGSKHYRVVGRRWFSGKPGLLKKDELVFDAIPTKTAGVFTFRTTENSPRFLCAIGRFKIDLVAKCSSKFLLIAVQADEDALFRQETTYAVAGEIKGINMADVQVGNDSVNHKQKALLETGQVGEFNFTMKVEHGKAAEENYSLPDGDYFIINRDPLGYEGKYLTYSWFWRRLQFNAKYASLWKLRVNPETGYYTMMNTWMSANGASSGSQVGRVVQSRWFNNIGLSDFDATPFEIVSHEYGYFCLRTVEKNARYLNAVGAYEVKLNRNKCSQFQFVRVDSI